jgi:hypothetical protein
MSRPTAWRRLAVTLLLASFIGCGGKATEQDTAVIQPDPTVPASKPVAKPATPPKAAPSNG